MNKKLQNIISKLSPLISILAIFLIWQVFASATEAYLLPSPVDVFKALISERNLLFSHLGITLKEAFLGLSLSIIFAFFVSILMDEFDFLYKLFYPVVIISQTVPTIAIAPLLVLWLGYGIAPKVALIFLTCSFPLLISILTGIKSADNDMINLFKSYGASKLKILTLVKLPYAKENFFSGLKVSTTYALVGAVIAEWLGGNAGLGVYMTRVRKAYAFDKMFAVIILITTISLALMILVSFLEKKSMPYKYRKEQQK